jgi:hypothetical protein
VPRCVNLAGIRYKAAAIACALAWVAPVGVQAGELHDLEEGVPVELEDVYPTPAHEKQVQLVTRYERTREHTDEGDVIARVQYGFAQDWQAAVGVPMHFGDTRHSGDVELAVFRKLAQEQGGWPAFAASLQADLPSGRDSHGLDTTLKLIATRSLRQGDEQSPRMHVNLAWMHNAGPLPDERADGWRAIAGYSQPIGQENVVVGDVRYERSTDVGHDGGLVELGWLHQVKESTTLGLSAGAGIGPQSPRARVTFSLQQSF